MTRTYLGDRIVVGRQSGILVLGDLLMIVVFVLIGELRHGNPLSTGIEPILQFSLGWAIAGIFFGAYAADAIDGPIRAATLGGGAWIVGALLGQVIRLATNPTADFALPFVLVSIGVGILLVGGWRLLAAIIL